MASGMGAAPAMLVDAHHVSAWGGEMSCDLRRVRTDGLHDFTPIGDDLVDGCCRVVHHDVHHQALGRGWCAAEDPGAADFAHSVVKRRVALFTLSDFPAEHALVEIR